MIKPTCLLDRHTLNDFPHLPCPRCESTIIPVDKKLDYQQSAESGFYQTHVESGPEYYGGVFSLHLKCSKKSCSENLVCVGSFVLTEDTESPDPTPDFIPSIKPYFFTPTIHIFPLHKDIPEKVSKALIESFSLYWSNPSAAGNALRVAIEALMDYRCVKKWIIDKNGKEQALSLHARIVEFKNNNSELAEKLLAIKWIGNGGSHLSGLDPNDMVIGYRLMEYVLDELFNNAKEELDRITKKINKTKKPA